MEMANLIMHVVLFSGNYFIVVNGSTRPCSGKPTQKRGLMSNFEVFFLFFALAIYFYENMKFT